MLGHIDSRYSTLAHADARTPVSRDQAAKKFEKIWIMADDEHSLPVGVLVEEFLKGSKVAVRGERCTHFDLRFVTHLGAYELGRLQRALEWTGDNYVDLYTQRAQHASNQNALIFAFLDERASCVKLGIITSNSRVGMTHQVEIHGFADDGNQPQGAKS